MSKEKSKEPFFMLPHALLRNPDYQSLSLGARRVLDCLMHQHDGFNNGDLSATLGDLKKMGMRSSSTLSSGLKELQEKNLITRTRKPKSSSAVSRVSALFAMKWLPIKHRNGRPVNEAAPRDIEAEANDPDFEPSKKAQSEFRTDTIRIPNCDDPDFESSPPKTQSGKRIQDDFTLRTLDTSTSTSTARDLDPYLASEGQAHLQGDDRHEYERFMGSEPPAEVACLPEGELLKSEQDITALESEPPDHFNEMPDCETQGDDPFLDDQPRPSAQSATSPSGKRKFGGEV